MSAAAPYDAREVSNFVLNLATNAGRSLTQMSLLKVVFYAHGWYLALKGEPLFRQPVEAWEHGPVIKVVRDAFKSFGKRPIERFAERLDLETGEFIPVGSDLAEDDAVFVSHIFNLYAHLPAFQLSDMTHEPGSPWDVVWNSATATGRLGLRITNDEIRRYFLLMNERATLH